jgi:hypothetical protein
MLYGTWYMVQHVYSISLSVLSALPTQRRWDKHRPVGMSNNEAAPAAFAYWYADNAQHRNVQCTCPVSTAAQTVSMYWI